MKATLRPWEVKDDHMVIESGLMTPVADCALSDYQDEDIDDVMRRAKANAELIVRATNNFESLVNVADALDRACMETTTPLPSPILEAWEMAIAVLADLKATS